MGLGQEIGQPASPGPFNLWMLRVAVDAVVRLSADTIRNKSRLYLWRKGRVCAQIGVTSGGPSAVSLARAWEKKSWLNQILNLDIRGISAHKTRWVSLRSTHPTCCRYAWGVINMQVYVECVWSFGWGGTLAEVFIVFDAVDDAAYSYAV